MFNFDPTAIIAILFTFGGPVAIVYIVATLKHRERMEALKRGINPGLSIHPNTGAWSLFLGLAGIAVGLALLLSLFVDYDTDMVTGGLIVLFSGCAFLLYWKLTAKDRERAFRLYEHYFEEMKGTVKPAQTDEAASQAESVSGTGNVAD
jgi:hypothetical protein